MKYIECSKSRAKKLGVGKILTPVRQSIRLKSKRKNKTSKNHKVSFSVNSKK